ncbi:oleosin G-like isoform X2 [Malania oleifera]|uniref:oleosin G-like isoform X2 n=1 Tax=Malania oleifera TaxID=397392 RepID=UPI0025ADD09F|nr:oleosin G-like isoform X2 [Malania oleifera]
MDQAKQVTQKLHRSAPSSRQTVKFLTATTIGATLLLLSGLTLTGTVMTLIVATPAFVLFSPILVPAGIVVLVAAAGLLFSGGCGVTGMSWIYDYVARKHPPGKEQLDYAGTTVAGKAREYGKYLQSKAREAAHVLMNIYILSDGDGGFFSVRESIASF